MSHAADAHHHPFHAHHFDDMEQQFDAGKLGMWLFLATEVLFFSGMFVAYTIYRVNHPEVFAHAHHYLDKWLGAFNTLVLLASSLSVAWGVRCSQLDNRKGLVGALLFTLSCAGLFMGVKAVEYTLKFHEGIFAGNSYSPPAPGIHPDLTVAYAMLTRITLGVLVIGVIASLAAFVPNLRSGTATRGVPKLWLWGLTAAALVGIGVLWNYAILGTWPAAIAALVLVVFIQAWPNNPGLAGFAVTVAFAGLFWLAWDLQYNQALAIIAAAALPVFARVQSKLSPAVLGILVLSAAAIAGLAYYGHTTHGLSLEEVLKASAVAAMAILFAAAVHPNPSLTVVGGLLVAFALLAGLAYVGTLHRYEALAGGIVLLALASLRGLLAADMARWAFLGIGVTILSVALGIVSARGIQVFSVPATEHSEAAHTHGEHGAEHSEHAAADHADGEQVAAEHADEVHAAPAESDEAGTDPSAADAIAAGEVPVVPAAADVDPSKINLATPADTDKRLEGVFFSIYYAMTGVHALHILGGIGVMCWIVGRAGLNQFSHAYYGPVEYVALYWHLVDLIWIFLFPLLYLIREPVMGG